MIKHVTLPPRKKLFGFDYNKAVQLCMTGKEWHQYAKAEQFKTENGNDAAWKNGCEVWLDGTNMEYAK